MRWRHLKFDLAYLLGELVIVVVGVAIALAANGAYEDWKEGRVETSYLQRISADLENGVPQLSNKERRNTQSVVAGVRLIDLLEQQSPDEHDVLVNFLYAAQTGGTAANSSHDTTFRELVSTGNLNIIRDAELRIEITEYYRRLDNYAALEFALPRDILHLFRSLTGEIPERFSTNDGGLERDFSNSEKDRILNELLENRDHYLKVLRLQTSLQGLIADALAELTNSNRSLKERLSLEF